MHCQWITFFPGSSDGAISTTGGPGGLSYVVGENTHHFGGFSGSGEGANVRFSGENERFGVSSSMALPGSSDGAISVNDGPGGLLDDGGEDTHRCGSLCGSGEIKNFLAKRQSEHLKNIGTALFRPLCKQEEIDDEEDEGFNVLLVLIFIKLVGVGLRQ